jgi:hypothetical protein
MEKEAQELQLYVGIHKLESTETEIIGFIAQKHPEMTHLNRFETALMTKLPMETPKLVIEHIFPKTTGVYARLTQKWWIRPLRDYFHLSRKENTTSATWAWMKS